MTPAETMPTQFERFKWTLLAEASEDWRGIWEAYTLATYHFPDDSAEHREHMAVLALSQLYRDDLILFFRMARDNHPPNPVNEETILSPRDVADVLGTISNLRWRPATLNEVVTWYFVTDSGNARVAELTSDDILLEKDGLLEPGE